MALPEAYQLDRYVIEGVLGSGGFGITYLAEDAMLGRRVAIKELLPADFATRVGNATVAAKGRDSDRENFEWARTRFLEEGRALAACKHPNVVDVYGAFAANGTAYLVTCYEEGQDLESWLRGLGRPPTEAELRGILTPLLSGLERVHEAGFLHRDIKPENIYLTAGGRPVLLDFGSARQAIGNRSRMLTAVITAGYAPFEQYHEGGHQGPWTDIYALGAVMYRAIIGEKPPEAAARMMGNDPYRSLATTQAGRYTAGFLKGLDRALRVKASERPQSIAQWRALLGEGPTVKIGKLPGRKRPPWWAWCLGSAALLGLAAWIVVTHFKSEPGPTSTPGAETRFPFAQATPPNQTAASTPNLPSTRIEPNPTPIPTQISAPIPMAISTPIQTPYPTPIPTPYPTPIPTPYPTPVPTPYGTPVPTPYPTPVDATADVLAFVQKYWKDCVSNDPDDWASDFADQSRYCYNNNRWTDRSFIRSDRAKLVERYPTRHYEFSDPRIQMESGGNSAHVTFSFTYRYSGAKSAGGSCHVAFTAERNSGTWLITEYDEKVYRQ